jgi:hypothetical protein
MVDQKLRSGTSGFFYPLSGDPDSFSRLDGGYRSHQGVRLPIVPVLQFEAVCPRDRAACQSLAMVNSVEDADPDSRAYGGNGDANPYLVGFGNAADGSV